MVNGESPRQLALEIWVLQVENLTHFSMVIMTAFPSVPQFHHCDEGDKAVGKLLTATTQRTTGLPESSQDSVQKSPSLCTSQLSNHVEFSGCLTATLRNIKLGSTGKGGSLRALVVRVPGISYSLASQSSFFKEII